MSATCGPPSRTPFAYYDPDAACWRTSQATFLSDSDRYSATWPRSGMTRAGFAYELPMPALRTAEPASSSSLPTPRAARGASGTETMYALGAERTDAGRSQGEVLLPTPVADHSRGLPQPGSDFQSLPNVALSLLPTPRATDGTKGGSNQRGSSGDLMLPSAVMALLPTPTASDFKASGGSSPSDVTLTDAVVRTSLGATTNPRFDGGSTLPAVARPDLLSQDEPESA